MKNVKKIVVVAVVSLIVVVGGGLFYLSRGLDDGASLEVGRFDVSKLEDGKYEGSFDFNRWSNTVEVEIKDNKIVAVRVIEDVTFVQEGVSDKLFDEVIKQQDVPEDLVSEATVTSKAYLKAIEDAIKGSE